MVEFQYGFEPGGKKVIWAICELTARFEKKTANLKIRLVEEPLPPPGFFEIPGNSLRLNGFPNIEIIENGVQR